MGRFSTYVWPNIITLGAKHVIIISNFAAKYLTIILIEKLVTALLENIGVLSLSFKVAVKWKLWC